MRNETRAQYNAYLSQLASLYGVAVADLATKFAVEPSIQQKLETKIQESSEFLNKINVIGVTDQEGEKVGLGVSGPLAGTTDTTKEDRKTSDISALSATRYRAEQTNFDSHIQYAKLDAWAKFPDFQTRIRDAILRRMALDRIMIGFNGIARAATSDKVKNPLLQDVNKGWLQGLREGAAARCIKGVQIGKGQEHQNIDALVFDMVNSLIEPWHREAPEMVVVCGRELVSSKYFPVINNANSNVERVAADVVMSAQRIGGLPAVSVPYFPAKGLMVTRLDNLSLYWQEGTRRRTVKDNAQRDRIENYESCNEAYVIEDFGCAALAEEISFADKAA